MRKIIFENKIKVNKYLKNFNIKTLISVERVVKSLSIIFEKKQYSSVSNFNEIKLYEIFNSGAAGFIGSNLIDKLLLKNIGLLV